MRYLPHTPVDRQAILEAIGVDRIDDLFVDVPSQALLPKALDLPLHAGEMAVEKSLATLAGRNVAAGATACFLGAGAYRHHVPAARWRIYILRALPPAAGPLNSTIG